MIRVLMADEGWAFFAPFLVEAAPKRDLPPDFGKRASVDRQFRRWTLAGLWELLLEAVNAGGGALGGVQMISRPARIRLRTLKATARSPAPIAAPRARSVDPEPRSWPFARRPLDQDRSPGERRGPVRRRRGQRRSGLGLPRLRRGLHSGARACPRRRRPRPGPATKARPGTRRRPRPRSAQPHRAALQLP